MTAPPPITSSLFAEALEAAGVIGDLTGIGRVVIDARAGRRVTVRTETAGHREGASGQQRTLQTTAQELGAALETAGIIGSVAGITRIVLDAKAGRPVVIHVERLGDERLLAIAATLTGRT